MEEKLRFGFEHELRERTRTELCERYESEWGCCGRTTAGSRSSSRSILLPYSDSPRLRVAPLLTNSKLVERDQKVSDMCPV
jgi:hypothetical protein